MNKSWVLYISTFPPRECGIATFTKELTTAMDRKFNPKLKSKLLAMNDNGSSFYDYGTKVKFQLDDRDIEAYLELAKRINKNPTIKLINIQHEFGIFGGEYGLYLIPFLETLEKPVVITFHSVLPNPDPTRKKVVKALAKRCDAIIVMAKKAIDILEKDYEIDIKKIYCIPHGTPSIPFTAKETKKNLGLEGKKIISTFGLLSKNKGVEYVIEALPQIVKEHPEALFLVIGETHPQVRKHEGEFYRNFLIKRVEELNLKSHVKFYNKYLTLKEIIKYLKATDVYVNSAKDPNQITSGTLAYAVGCGKAIVATRSLYASEILSEERGIIVDFGDSTKIAESINYLLSNPEKRKEMEKKAYEYGRQMVWNNVAAGYLNVYKSIIEISEKIGLHKFPRIRLNHLINLTDDTGVIQHAKHTLSDRAEGYTLDDNARSLMVAVKYYQKTKEEATLKLVNTYLSFIRYMQKEDGKFHNLLSYDRKFLDKEGSEDSFGRTLWATGYLINTKLPEGIRALAKFIFDNAVKHVPNLKSPRAKAFSILGMYHYYKVHKHPDIILKVRKLSDSLLKRYQQTHNEDWIWFEDYLTYSNGRLPESLFYAYDMTKEKKYLEVAEKTLNFLSSIVLLDNKLVLIGHNGWFNKNGKRAFYDQQPVDAASMVQAYLAAYKITKKEEYYEKALISFNWFLGKNSLNQTVYDESTGGCYDGLLPNCINLNQGAESTISYLIARLSFD